jgi:hypothetical protein
MELELQRIAAVDGVSPDVSEIIDNALDMKNERSEK